MSVEAYRQFKLARYFYRGVFRRVVFWVVTSLLINSILVFFIGRTLVSYLNTNSYKFYATNGETPPTLLSAMSHPNRGSEYLLRSDRQSDNKYTMVQSD